MQDNTEQNLGPTSVIRVASFYAYIKTANMKMKSRSIYNFKYQTIPISHYATTLLITRWPPKTGKIFVHLNLCTP